MAEDEQTGDSPHKDHRHGGRLLIAGVMVLAIILIALIGTQTVRGSLVSGGTAVGWWAEPGLAPGVFLIFTIVASAAAFFFANRETINWHEVVNDYGRVGILSGAMVGTVFLLSALGFALSILVFSGVVALIAGYRGGRLATIAIGATVAMVLIFRVGFGVWFPRPALFKVIDLPFWLQGVL